jgi:hypothetical protein
MNYIAVECVLFIVRLLISPVSSRPPVPSNGACVWFPESFEYAEYFILHYFSYNRSEAPDVKHEFVRKIVLFCIMHKRTLVYYYYCYYYRHYIHRK